ncbi:nesprin-2-like isoform X1 [Perca flavescens]|uniref:nesprin-2-like isoform X1 n=1 Tax=Perca flavescens TaxID=8167 RepID=UPI00106F07D0|nr:nesprin-2-like isoform X1 [Perca flavescens]
MTEESESQRSALSLREQTESVIMEETMLIPTRRKSKSTEHTTTSQHVVAHNITTDVEPEDNKKEPDSLKYSSTPQMATEATNTTVVKEKKLSPTKRRSKGPKLSPEHATKEVTETKKESGSQKPSLSSGDLTETAALDETKRIATIILDVSEPFTSVPVTTEVTTTLALKQADQQPARMMAEPESQRSALSLREQTESVVMEVTKLIPTRRKSKSTELTTTKHEPGSQKPSLSSGELTETVVVEETEVIPTRRKSKGLEVSTVPEPVSPLGILTGMEPKELKQESENDPATLDFIQRQAKTAVVEQSKLLPPKRKSKSTEPPLKLVDTQAHKTRIEPEGHQYSLSSNDPNRSVVIEETKLLPNSRKSKSGDYSTSSETVATLVRLPAVEPEQNKKELDGKKSSTPDVVTEPTESTVVKIGELSPTKIKSKGLKLSPDLSPTELTKTKEEPDNQKQSSSQEVVTTTEITVVDKGELLSTKGKSKSLKPSQELATTKLTKTKEEPHSQKPSSTPEVVKAPTEITEITVVVKGKHSPTKEKTKGLILSQELATTVLTKSKEEPVCQKPSSAPEAITAATEITVVEKGKLSPTKRKSKGLKHSPELATTEVTQTNKESDSQKPSSTPEVVTATTELSVVEKGKLSPTKIMSKGLKLSSELATTELMDAKKESDSQTSSVYSREQTEAAVLEEFTIPARRKPKSLDVSTAVEPVSAFDGSIDLESKETKEEPESGKASAGQLVTVATETAVLTKRKSKGLNLSPERSPTELTKTKEEPHSQKPSSTPEVVKAPTEITVVEKGKLSPTKRKSKCLKLSSELSATEQPKTKEEPDSQTSLMYSCPAVEPVSALGGSIDLESKEAKKEPESGKASAGQVVTGAIEISVVKDGMLSPTQRKSKGLKHYPELATTELTKTNKEPFSIQEVVTETTEMTFVEKGKLSPTKKMLEGMKLSSELATTELMSVKKESDSQTSSMSSREQTEAAVSEEFIILARRKVGPEVQILQLDIPTSPEDENTSVTGAKRIRPVQTSLQREGVAESKDMTAAVKMTTIEVQESGTECQDNVVQTGQPSPACEALPPDEAGTEFVEISISERHMVKPSQTKTQSGLFITMQEKPKVVKKHGVQEQHPTLSTRGMDSVPKSLDEKSVTMEKIHMGPEVRILQLDIPTSLEKDKNTSVTRAKEPRVDSVQTRVQSERVPENKDITTAYVKPAEAVEMTKIKVKESSTKFQDNMAQRDSAQPTPPGSESLQQHETEREFIQISVYEQDIVKPSQTDTKMELLKPAQDWPTEVKGHVVQEEHPEVLTHGMHDVTKSLDEKFMMKKIHMGSEVHILQLDTTSMEKDENTSVTRVKEPRIDVGQTRVQCERAPENKDKTTPDVKQKKAAVKTRLEVQQITTEGQGNVAQSDSNQPPSVCARQLSDAETTFEEISISEQDTVNPSQTVMKLELMNTTEKRPQKVKDHDVQEVNAKVSTKDVHDAPQSLDEKSVRIDNIHKGAEVHILQPGTPVTIKEHEIATVAIAKVSRIDIDQTSIQCETVSKNKDLTSADVQPEKTKDKMTMVEVKTKERLKDRSIHEKHAEVSAHDMHNVSKSLDEKSVTTGDIHISVHDYKTVTIEKEPEMALRILFETVKESKDVTTTDKSSSEMTWVEVQESFTESLSEPSVVPRAQTERLTTDAKANKKEEKEGKRTIQKEEREMMVKLDIKNAPLPMAKTSTTGEVTLQRMDSPQDKPLEDAPEALITSTIDLDNRLSRLVSRILSCKNHPAELNPTAMAQQLKEAQQCRETAQEQVSLLSQLRGADAENSDALEHVEDQWSTAAQDAAAVIQSKEAQLLLVTDHCRQTKAARTTLERLTAELDAVRMSPEESSSKEAERLCSLQRSMEENRTVLGELLVTHTKLYPHLSWSKRALAQTEQNNLQEKWRSLERAVERTLYHTNVHFHETSSLQLAISDLQEHLETIGKDLEAKSPSVTQWNCKKAQQLMVANAEVKAAWQKYLHLQQLLEALLLGSQWEKDTTEIQKGLQSVKDQLCHTEELVSSQTQSSSNAVMEKMMVVMRDGLVWAKQTESEIDGRRKRVALFPEEVHRQLRDLKKLQSKVMAKQGQLETLVEEVTELLSQLDQAEEVPMVRSSLKSLQELSKWTSEKLAKAVREIESGLQTREKLSEQIADLDSWVLAHLHREASRSPDSELRSPAELDRRVRQIQETLAEAAKQAAVCEALLMKSKDIASELSITENCWLFDKLTNLQEDITAISSCEKANKKELDELNQTLDSSKKNLVTIETSLRQMLVDLSRYRFPITSKSLQALEPSKHMILEHKSQVDLLQHWIPQEKTRELYSVTSELLSKMVTLEMKARSHERYLNNRQCVEDLRENVQEQVRQAKDDSLALDEKYQVCQTLLVQLPLIKYMSEEAGFKLQMISTDLYPSQLSTERQRLKQNEGSIDTLEMMLYNNLSIMEWNLLKDLDLDSEKAATQAFLWKSQQELQKLPMLEPNETEINDEYQRIMSLKKTVESRMRALEVLEQKKGKRQRHGSQDLIDLKNAVLCECDSQMENVCQAKESLRGYTCAVQQAAQFLRDIEVSLLPPQGSAGLCSGRLEETRQALASLQQQFQTHVERLQSQVTLHPYLSPQKVEQLQEKILSQLLVRMSTLQAKGHIRLECLSSCTELHRKYTQCQDEIIQSVKSAENSLSQFICQKVTCLADCTDQQTKLRVLSEDLESLQSRLAELKEWCPEQSCRGGREAAVAAVWKHVSRLHRYTQQLTARSERRIAECSEITNSVVKASALLQQVEAELPDGSRVKASTEDLQDLLQSWEQYQDRLDCEHRALSALELRTARLLGVPAHLEQAPPTPLCQQLQAIQARYGSVKQRSREGLKAARMELEEREKVRLELQAVRVWLEAADGLLSEMEQSSSTEELQEVHSELCNQKALLQRIMESLKMKYSDMYTLVPVEIDSQLQEVTHSLQQVEVKVGEAVEQSGPIHRLGAKLSEVQAGLTSVQKRLDQRSPNVTVAKITQKRVWDELDLWHSCVAALEVDMQDLEKPEEVLTLTERLVEVQQLHSQLAKQAEQRTTLLSKIQTWLQEHQEMISSSKSWMDEAKSWLATPCTYTTAKCLSSHVHTLQMVLDDSAQIRTTLQGFASVLKEMSQVCDVTTLQEQLDEADHQVANVQDRFNAPLSYLGHAADEVEAIEIEVRQMENDVAEIKILLSSPETFPSPREESLKAVEQRIQCMRRTVAEIQKCKPGLCLPEKAEDTLTVFTVVDQLQTLLLELEKKVPALFIQQPSTPVQAKAPSEQMTSQPQRGLLESTSEEAEKDDMEQGHIRIVHVKEDVLKGSGASRLNVEQSSPEQRPSRTPDSTEQREHDGVLQAEEATEHRKEEGGGGVLWWLWDAFLAASPEEPVAVVPEETEGAAGQSTKQTGEDRQDVEGSPDTTEASSSEALSKPLGTVRTQSVPESMVNTTASTVKVSKPDAGPQQKCVVS